MGVKFDYILGQLRLDDTVQALDYKGTWNATTNTPTLVSGTGTKNEYYIVSVAGTTTLDGISDWDVGDWVLFNGVTWVKNSSPVTLDQLNDVGITSVADNDLLQYNSATGLWENVAKDAVVTMWTRAGTSISPTNSGDKLLMNNDIIINDGVNDAFKFDVARTRLDIVDSGAFGNIMKFDNVSGGDHLMALGWFDNGVATFDIYRYTIGSDQKFHIYNNVVSKYSIEIDEPTNNINISDGLVVNASAGDNDFTINKLTSGIAYKYDAGLDTHTFNGDITASVASAINVDFNINNSITDWVIRNATNGSLLLRNNTTGVPIIELDDAASKRAMLITDVRVNFNSQNADLDFLFGKNTSGNALDYDSGLDSWIMDGTTITLTTPANNALLTSQPTGADDLAIATTKYVDDNTFWSRAGTIISPKTAGDSLTVDGSGIFNSSAGDNDFTINALTSGTAYKYDAGTGVHTWTDSAANDGFNFVSTNGNCELNMSGAGATLIEMTAGGVAWRNNITAGGDWKFRDHTNTQDVMFIRQGATGIVLDLTTTNTIFNASAIDLDFTINKLTTGTAYVYDAGIDKHTFNGDFLVTDAFKYLDADTGGVRNHFIGVTVGDSCGADNNTGFGFEVFQDLTLGYSNVALGTQAGTDLTIGFQNTFVGYQAGNKSIETSNNTALGSGALYNNRTGAECTAIGTSALRDNPALANAVAIGKDAGRGMVGNNGVAVGHSAGKVAGTACVMLGYQAGQTEAGDNKLYIANSSTTTPLILGDFSTPELGIHGNFIANKGNADYDFTINKNTSGIAYVYNAGLDTHDFNSDVTVNTSNVNINNTGTPAGVWVNRTDGKILGLVAGSGNSTFRFDDSAGFLISAQPRADLEVNGGSNQVQLVNITTSNATFNNASGDVNFTINKNVSGTAYVYDAGLDTHSFSGSMYSSGKFVFDNNKPIYYKDSAGTESLVFSVNASDVMTMGPYSGSLVDQFDIRLGQTAVEMRFSSTEYLFNVGSNDRDFTINKNTSGTAFVYDAGDDDFTFNSAVHVVGANADTTNTGQPSGMYTYRTDGGATLMGCSINSVIRFDDTTFLNIQGQTRAGMEAQNENGLSLIFRFQTSQVTSNPNNGDIDFVIEKNTSGTAYKYDAGNDTHTFSSDLQSDSGRKVATNRITGVTTLDTTYHNVYCDTDGGAFTVTLPAGDDGRYYRIINTGTSGNDVTIAPNGAELLTGVNASRTISDGSVVVLVYETTEGWW